MKEMINYKENQANVELFTKSSRCRFNFCITSTSENVQISKMLSGHQKSLGYSRPQLSQIHLNGVAKAVIQRIADQRMAY